MNCFYGPLRGRSTGKRSNGPFASASPALIFLVIGLIAGVLGFTGVAGTSTAIAKVLFFIFIAIFAVLMIAGLTVANRIGGR